MLENIVDNKKLIHAPIETPDHPYIASLKDFGADELLAGAVDIGSTSLVAALASPAWRNAILPFVGPVIEKGVFFVRHAINAHKIYATVPEQVRQPFSFYLKQGLRGGGENLVKDLIFHDPLYISMMAGGLKMFPDVPPFMLSALAYGTAVLMVAGIDVAKNDIAFEQKKRSLKKIGFESEKYLESRFFIPASQNQEELIDGFAKEFGLSNVLTNKYDDIYFETGLASYNGRKPKMRFRSRETAGGDGSVFNTVQLVYSRAKESKKRDLEQVRYFMVEKEKIYLVRDSSLNTIEETSGPLRLFLDRSIAPRPVYTQISFERTVCNNKELAVCLDSVIHERPFYVLEFKTWQDKKLMQQAMRYLMVEFPIVSIQTTHGKRDLLSE